MNKALLLAASLKEHLRCDHELIAAVPTPAEIWGTPEAEKLKLLEKIGARVVPIANDIDCSYAIGNKVSCLRIGTDAQRLIFVDTDVMLIGSLGDERSFDMPFSAKAADTPSSFGSWQWRRVYASAGLKVPSGCVATTLYGQLMRPYFNAGFIAVDPSVGFGDAWLDCCRRIDRQWGIKQKRPHLDQIALSVAVARLGLKYECLDQRYNFPAHFMPVDSASPPLLVHYHAATVLRREPLLVEQVLNLCGRFPQLGDLLKEDPEFSPLLTTRPNRPSRLAAPTNGNRHPRGRSACGTPELIITGIPRSGTSLLCNLLHRFENVVVVNEPDEIARPLRKEPIPYGVGAFYRDIRRDVREGAPIRNKLRDGQVTDETLLANDLTAYCPSVSDADFVLGIKNPLGFLYRLADLQRVMPHARILACVRNPFDTIASWKTSFPHLRSAKVIGRSAGGRHAVFLSPLRRDQLREVGAVAKEAWRRAAWWRFMADLLLDMRDRVMLVPYEQLAADPMTLLEQALSGFDPGALRDPVAPTSPRTGKRSALDAEDLQAIRALCCEHAAALGVAETDVIPVERKASDVTPVAEGRVDSLIGART